MLKRLTLMLAAAGALAIPFAAGPAAAQDERPAGVRPVAHIEIASMMGRWYEVARFPNSIQRGCQAGASDWIRTAADAFAVTQTCHKGTPDGPLAEWKAKARIADPSNAKIKMSFFGGLVSQEYWVVEQRSDEGWLVMATHDGRYLWLMSQKPTLPVAVKTEAVARIKQLGFDIGRLEYPLPGRS
jgi:apolipoprotein D and lipocalin family protein